MIKKLEQYAIKIDSIKGKGYALLQPLILLDSNKIKKKLSDEKLSITVFESITSTNDYLRSLGNIKSIHICLAEQQTQGRGRLNRSWHSPFGKNIYLSCFYPFQKDISELSGLSLVISLAIMKTLKKMGVDEKLFVKWPNDILYDHQKISGALIEIQAESHGHSYAVIGIGVNVNMREETADPISQAWTSLEGITGKYVDRNDLCAELIKQLLAYLRKFNTQGFAVFIEEWMQADGLMGQTITMKNVREEIKGKVVGINEQGHLLLELPNHTVRAFSSGDASIVKKTKK